MEVLGKTKCSENKSHLNPFLRSGVRLAAPRSGTLQGRGHTAGAPFTDEALTMGSSWRSSWLHSRRSLDHEGYHGDKSEFNCKILKLLYKFYESLLFGNTERMECSLGQNTTSWEVCIAIFYKDYNSTTLKYSTYKIKDKIIPPFIQWTFNEHLLCVGPSGYRESNVFLAHKEYVA